MLDIALDFRAIEYVTDLGVTVRAMRAFVDVEFPTQAEIRERKRFWPFW